MYNFRSLLIPSLVCMSLIWVFSRPFSAIALWLYSGTGAVVNNFYDAAIETQANAATLLEAQGLARKLRLANQRLTIANFKLKAENRKIAEYEKALNFKTNFAHPTVFARIIGRSPDSWHKQIIIDKGSEDGIVLGRGVLTSKGIIGQVSKLGPHSSVVQLVFNPDWRMGVKIARLNQYGVLIGSFPEPARLQFITMDSEVEVGDEIVSSGICIDAGNCPYPENFPVGQVIAVSRDPNVVDLLVKVRFYEDLSTIKEVFVLK